MSRHLLGRAILRLVPPYGRHGKKYLWHPFVFAGAIFFLLLISAGTSYAFIDVSTTATGKVTVASLKPVSIVGAGLPSSPLLPGARGDVVFSVHNPNGSPVSLVGVTPKPGSAITTGVPGCTTTDGRPVVVFRVPPVDLPHSIPAETTTMIHLANAARMDTTATNNCQGASFTIPLTITVEP